MQSALLKKYKNSINKIACNHGVRSVRVFGSFARGEENADSDIDLLVELEPKRSLLVPYSSFSCSFYKKMSCERHLSRTSGLDIISLKYEIEDLTGRKVDVLTTKGISPYLAEQIIKEAVPL